MPLMKGGFAARLEGVVIATRQSSADVGGIVKRLMKNPNVVRNYYVLPCCLLLLNLCIEIVSYKVKVLDDALLRTAAIMAMVLFGGSFVGFVMAPAISLFVSTLHRSSRRGAGQLGEILFLLFLGLAVFWLYYRIYNIGPQSVLPATWHNPRH